MKDAYSYVVLRYVHDILSGEFVNVGVVVFSKGLFAKAQCLKTYGRITKVFPGAHGKSILHRVRSIESRINGIGDTMAHELELQVSPKSIEEIVHAVLPQDDSSLQWSSSGSGVAENLNVVLDELFKRMVLLYDDPSKSEGRSDEEIWRIYKREFESRSVLKDLKQKTIAVSDDAIDFPHAWKNERWHCLQALSFDLSSADGIREKAHNWLGKMASVKDASERFKVYVLLGEPRDKRLHDAYTRAVGILGRIPVESQIVTEKELKSFVDEMAATIVEHRDVK